MSNEIALPDYLRDMIAGGEVKVDADSMISQGGSVPRISLKGRMFRFKRDGEELSKSNGPIHVIIVGVTPEASNQHSKTFYKNGYQPNSDDPPDCSSTDGVTPDSWISDPVHNNCAQCPQNAWGSAKSMSGKKAKACRDSKRAYVMDAKDLKEEGEPTVWLLNVTVSSLRAFSDYGKILKANSLPMAAVISTLSMADSEFPQLDFAFGGVLQEKQGRKCIDVSNAKAWIDSVPSGPAIEHKPDTPKLSQTPVTVNEDGSIEASAAEAQAIAEQKSGPKDVDDIINQWGS
jgi:hypothetical protein